MFLHVYIYIPKSGYWEIVTLQAEDTPHFYDPDSWIMQVYRQ